MTAAAQPNPRPRRERDMIPGGYGPHDPTTAPRLVWVGHPLDDNNPEREEPIPPRHRPTTRTDQHPRTQTESGAHRMSAIVKLSSKMPGEPEINGVDHEAADLRTDPEALRVAVVYYDVAKVVHDVDTGTDVPTIRVRRIEPIGRVEDVPDAVRKVVAKAEETRTGRKAIPFGIVEVGEHAFGDTLDDADN